MDAANQRRLAELIRTERYAALGTLHDGAPLVSMILYAASPDFQEFYTLISTLAHHTQDILKNPLVSLMLIETGQDASPDPQQLARLSLGGNAFPIARDDPNLEAIKSIYLDKYPQAAFNLTLKDFAFHRIIPRSARYVGGFAQAFNLGLDDLKRIAELK